MREDKAIIGLSKATEENIKVFANASKLLTTWDCIDQLTEEELDRLAEELNITWYNKLEPINVKIDLILNSDKVYQKLGTKWAVENVINSYFGEGHISEWFEYEGKPGHFRIFSSNPTITNEKLIQFLDILEKVKRRSAHLDGVFITLTGQMKLSMGMAYHEVSHERLQLGKPFA